MSAPIPGGSPARPTPTVGAPAHVLARTVRALPTILRIALAEMVAYRAEMVIWILSATLPLVMMALWNAAAEAGPIQGFGQDDFVRYFAVTLVVRQLTGAWIVWELNHQIRTGALSQQLLRPLHPIWWSLCETVAALPWRVLVLAPILAALWLWNPDVAFVPEPTRTVAFFASTALAFLVAFLVQAAFGMLAFWFDQSLGLFQVWFFTWAVLGGYVVPLPLLPPDVARVAALLPFHATLGAPVDVLLGLGDAGRTLAVQAVWVLALAALDAALWRSGIRRYGAVGA